MPEKTEETELEHIRGLVKENGDEGNER
ncbi:hypothetical protein A2U01_0106238 [Trifolium medium]|uniref:Uncharacterized protein n=1 Tax=Trifolium medium TaxID=97028 RepID=A0A392VEN4_9FABA|nr:hypothetical protein [Trifolium medium]